MTVKAASHTIIQTIAVTTAEVAGRSHCRGTASGLHAPHATRQRHEHAKDAAFDQPYDDMGERERADGLLIILFKAQIQHADTNDSASQDTDEVSIEHRAAAPCNTRASMRGNTKNSMGEMPIVDNASIS